MHRYIFLDIDGVLNHQEFYRQISKSERVESRIYLNDSWGEMFCPNSTMWLNRLIVETEAKIVISSTKRFCLKHETKNNLEILQEMWKDRGFKGEVVGYTPNLFVRGMRIPRGVEIEHYLNKDIGFYHLNWDRKRQLEIMLESQLLNYIIIDDDSDMLYTQKEHFVHVLSPPRHFSGFDEKYYHVALKKLKSDILSLNYPRLEE